MGNVKFWLGPIMFFERETTDHRILTGHGMLFPLKVPVLAMLEGHQGPAVVGTAGTFHYRDNQKAVWADLYVDGSAIPGSLSGQQLYPAVDLDSITISVDAAKSAPEVMLISGGVLRAITLTTDPVWDKMQPVVGIG